MDQEKLIPEILIGAIAAAGPIAGNETAWKGRVSAAIPHIAALISEGGRPWKIAEEVLNAAVFEATFKSKEFEESSQRWVLMIDTGRPSETYPDGVEPIRTHRVDNPQGREMAERIKALSPGDKFFVWKVMEAMAGSATKKSRLLVHFEKRYSQDATRVTPASGSTAPPPHEEAPPPPDPEAPVTTGEVHETGPMTDKLDSVRLRAWKAGAAGVLTAEQMKIVVDELKANGYSWQGVSEIEWDEIVRPIIRRVRNG